MRTTRSLALTTAAAAATVMGLAGPANAAPQQNGLVNVNVTDVTVQVPIGVAANVCGVNAAVLVQDFTDGSAQCEGDAFSEAEITPAPGNGGPGRQEGLVNLNLDNITVQIPVSLAANICDVNVAVLTSELSNGPTNCDADATSVAGAITPV